MAARIAEVIWTDAQQVLGEYYQQLDEGSQSFNRLQFVVQETMFSKPSTEQILRSVRQQKAIVRSHFLITRAILSRLFRMRSLERRIQRIWEIEYDQGSERLTLLEGLADADTATLEHKFIDIQKTRDRLKSDFCTRQESLFDQILSAIPNVMEITYLGVQRNIPCTDTENSDQSPSSIELEKSSHELKQKLDSYLLERMKYFALEERCDKEMEMLKMHGLALSLLRDDMYKEQASNTDNTSSASQDSSYNSITSTGPSELEDLARNSCNGNSDEIIPEHIYCGIPISKNNVVLKTRTDQEVMLLIDRKAQCVVYLQELKSNYDCAKARHDALLDFHNFEVKRLNQLRTNLDKALQSWRSRHRNATLERKMSNCVRQKFESEKAELQQQHWSVRKQLECHNSKFNVDEVILREQAVNWSCQSRACLNKVKFLTKRINSMMKLTSFIAELTATADSKSHDKDVNDKLDCCDGNSQCFHDSEEDSNDDERNDDYCDSDHDQYDDCDDCHED